VPVDLPCDDDAAGLPEYADAVVRAIGRRRTDIVLVAHSLAGFTAPLVCERIRVELLVMLTAMIPRPGERPADWWANTGYPQSDDDLNTLFYNDVPAKLAAECERHTKAQSDTPMQQPWPMTAWPDVKTRFLLCRDDRFFPAEFMRRVVRERLGIAPDEMVGGHMVMLSRPGGLADHLAGFVSGG
jgi:pimeloyl-ACP methyl ester carboxylesterase